MKYLSTPPSHYLGIILGLLSMLFITACSDSSDTAGAGTESGDLQIAITDAEEDFLSYKIALDAITLKRIDGTSVSILPLSTEIDFVQYQELSELFAVLSVPRGTYSSITMSLDYSNADIVIQDEEGMSYQAAAVNALGEALAKVDVELTLNDNQYIYIAPSKVAKLTLDLDLAASNTIESFVPAVVTVEPFMIGTTELTADREHRVRGLLKAVTEADHSISLIVRPMRLKQGQFGEFTFNVNDETLYEIDGIEYTGQAGLTAMAALDTETPVIAFGQANTETQQRYIASQVHAGSSVPWANSDVLKGIITQRTDNTITLEGAVIELADQTAHFRQNVEMRVSEDSTVTGYRLGDADIANLSIGQEVLALGVYDADSNTFNAEDNYIRMKLNRIVGEVSQTSPLKLALSHINKRPVAIFDFTGTGTGALDDAHADDYEVDTRSLDINNLEVSEWVQVRGYPTAFGSAPLDFDALSIINPDFSSHAAKLQAHWWNDDVDNVSINNGMLVLNNETARSKLHLRGVPNSSKLGLSVDTITGNSESGRYALLVQGRGIHFYREFDSFVSALEATLSEGLEVKHLTASGMYSSTQHTLQSSDVRAQLAMPRVKEEKTGK